MNHMLAPRFLAITSVLLFAGLLVSPSQAQTPAVSVINQSGGAHSTNTFGWRFTVGALPIVVTDLGFWDDGANGLLSSHQVGIWDVNTAVLVGSATVATGFGDPIDAAGWRYNSGFTPFQLAANATYVIGALAPSSSDAIGFLTGPDATNVTLAPGIAAFHGGRFSSGSTFSIPTNDAGEGRYFGPNFRFTDAPVPVTPSTWGGVKSTFIRR